MPRPERVLHPDADTLHAFANRLRQLRESADNPTYQKMARYTGRSRSALAEAAGGEQLPKWDTVVDYVRACQGEPNDFRAEWERVRSEREGSPVVEPFEGLANLPRRAVPHIFGRAAILGHLNERIDAARTGITIGPAVFGLGGVGKTELALQYAHSFRHRYKPLWWIDAETSETVAAGLCKLTRGLRPGWPVSAGIADTAAWALRWLATHSGWLVVLDNVVDPVAIEGILAASGDGRVLVTSRRGLDWDLLGLVPVPVPVLERKASLELLERRSGRYGERAELDRIAMDLGDLPLALSHAAAYLAERPHVSTTEYRERLARNPIRVLDVAPRTRPAESPASRTWHVSIDAIEAENPLASRLLAIMAYLSPDRIPLALLTHGQDPLEVDDAVALAASYSLISQTGPAVSMHRLVQTAIRAFNGDGRRGAAEALIAAIPQGDPETTVATWETWSMLVPHIEALAGHGALDAMDAELLARCAMYLRGQGRYKTAASMAERAYTLRQQILGKDHPATITSRYVTAGCLWSVGRLDEAASLGAAVLADRQRLLGPEHPDTLHVAGNLGIGLRELGKHDEAIALTRQTLAARERVLGDAHPETLHSRNNLAGCLRAMGMHAEALPLYESTLATREQVLGAEHPDTLQSRNNLAGGLQAVGLVAEALQLYGETIATRNRVLGSDHPDTLTSRHNLALARGSLSELRAVLAAREEVLGPDHPDTMRSREAVDQHRP
ncbi:tetratricopeptide repeat protein [Actinoplanes sp. LDG1-06]|uniref:Tetratricopeptide repeat protein n=1 Tax=Paractinoplanes ovalisporus TaxID=2810368 RepID=A0ABS2AUH4_9ACTN|nr:FxSxx-COOH system tetratricopeptide repeat protein [Actinoplanes ovalisporus]MBM2623373.1 tetratricopeptide repeat protein [Actinoplanes ovalisporus]